MRTAARTPRTQEPLLLQAAAHLELADDRDRASDLYDRLLSSPADPENPHLIKALQAANLWEYGHEAEARALIDGHPRSGPARRGPVGDHRGGPGGPRRAGGLARALHRGAYTLLLAGATRQPPYATTPLLTGRHRVRRLLGAAHDDWDVLADTRHIGPIPLDELHDPKRIWALGSDDPAELRAEIARLRAELGDRRAALSRPFPVAVLHWPARELAELLTAYPTLASEYPSHEAHLATIEASLRDLAASGTTNLGIVTATVPSYEAFAASEGVSPGDAALLPQYATTLAARGRAVAWPPERGAVCWCGSGQAYGECHGVE